MLTKTPSDEIYAAPYMTTKVRSNGVIFKLAVTGIFNRAHPLLPMCYVECEDDARPLVRAANLQLKALVS